MQLDNGLAIVVLAILIFYLRLIILQRERVKRTRAALARNLKKGKGKKPLEAPRYSILSQNRRDWVIAGAGMLAIVLGALVNAGVVFRSIQSYWWLPTALGIVAFSWAFNLQRSDDRA